MLFNAWRVVKKLVSKYCTDCDSVLWCHLQENFSLCPTLNSIFWILNILKIGRTTPFCNLFMEWYLYIAALSVHLCTLQTNFFSVLLAFLPTVYHFIDRSDIFRTYHVDRGRHTDHPCPAGWLVCLLLLIFPCIIKSRSSLLAPAHPGGLGKRAVKRLCYLYWNWLFIVAVILRPFFWFS